MTNKTDALVQPRCFAALIDALNAHFTKNAASFGTIVKATKFTGGFSNLTYLLQNSQDTEWVLRMPPHGANIQTAHDMSREFKVLSLLKPHYPNVPQALYFGDSGVIAPFYLMQKLNGTIFRGSDANNPKHDIFQHSPEMWRKMSLALVENLVQLHSLDLEKTGLNTLGKPEGYVERQVNGWIKRYDAAQTDDIEAMPMVANWLMKHLPRPQNPAFLHNDYKYDNVVFDLSDNTPNIVGVLDWEMSTVGDPLMDLGAALAYWVEKDDAPLLHALNVTWFDGNLTRSEVIEQYGQLSGRDMTDIHFYYVFGLYKNAVIAQQIYARWKAGHSQDARFGSLIFFVKQFAEQALNQL